MNLTEHFTSEELGVENADPRVIANAIFLCEKILEPIRAQFGPVHVHDGYRNPEHNAAVGGKSASWHLFDGTHAAADIDCLPTSLYQLFEWIWLDSGLLFDKVIMEKGPNGLPQTIHIQVDTIATPRRLAYTGGIGNSQSYTPQRKPTFPS